MALSTKPRVLFSNPPWWVSETPCQLSEKEQSSLHTAGVRAGSRWPFTYSGRSTPGRRDLSDYMPYPFFMGYAASYVEQKTGAHVRLRDSIATRETYDSYFLFLLQNRFDVIFFESASPSWEHDRLLIEQVRALLPDVEIAVCGPIATMGESVLSQAPIDAVIKGEYEKGAVKFVNGARPRGVIDFDLLTTDEMNTAPFPRIDGLTWAHYWDANPKGQIAPQLQAWTSRGCPYKCIFCVWPAAMTGNDPDGSGKRAVRHYTPEYMHDFLTIVTDGSWCDPRTGGIGRMSPAYGSVYFDDDTFNLGDRHVLEMCGVMARFNTAGRVAAGAGLPWSAMCRADTIHRSTWRVMKEAGCFGVKIGFESGNQHVVDQIVNKRLDLEAARDTVAYLHELGMTVHGTFTYGLPGETREQMADTKRYIRSLQAVGMDTYQESGCAEIEGAPLRTLAERGTLVAFPAARADAEYRPMANGSEKLAAMARGVGTAVEYANHIEGWMEPDELAWLYETASRMRTVCEVGSFKGRSTHALCAAGPERVVAVDHFRPEHLMPMQGDEVFEEFQRNTRGFSNLVVNRKWSTEAADDYPDASFDMVFLDAGHDYTDILADIRAWRPKARLLLCGHDYREEYPGVIRAVDEELGPVEVCNTIWAKSLVGGL